MIERHWKGLIKFTEVPHYEAHLKTGTFVKLAGISGFIGAKMLKRQVTDGMEFLVITTWESLDAIRRFAGDDIDHAVVPQIAADMMVSYDRQAVHYEVVV